MKEELKEKEKQEAKKVEKEKEIYDKHFFL